MSMISSYLPYDPPLNDLSTSHVVGTKMQGHGKAKMLEPYLISWSVRYWIRFQPVFNSSPQRWSIATSVDLLISINLVWWFVSRIMRPIESEVSPFGPLSKLDAQASETRMIYLTG